MDNNFVNIDDLVRQRLGGGQEPERSGAWSRMEQLLEKEDRRKPFGLYWKRAMSYCGVAMLLAAVSVGGYELTSAFRSPGIPAAGSAGNGVASGMIATNTATGEKATAANPKVAVDAPHTSKHTASGHTAQHTTNSGALAMNEHNVASTAQNETGNDAVTSAANGTQQNTTFASTGTSTSHAHQKQTGNHSVSNTSSTNTSNNNTLVAGTSAIGNTSKNIDNRSTKNIAETGSRNTGIAKTTNNSVAPVAEIPNLPDQPKNDHVIDRGHGSAYVSKLNNLPLGSTSGKNNIVPAKVVAVTPPVAPNTALAPATHTPPVFKPIAGKQVLQRIVMQETKIGTYEGRTETRLDTVSIDQFTRELKKAREENEAASAAAQASAAANVNDNNSTAGKTTGSNTTGSKAGNAGNKKSNVAASTNNNNTQHNATAGITPAAGSKSATGSSTADNTLSGTQASADNLSSATNGDVQAPAEITPNAAAPKTATPPATENKPPITNKKHGLNMAESLSNMFNQVKYKLGGAQFAPGLTAGINGTFFGPNSFKGFQFGVTGGFELDDTWSFMAELKYFHRMNNDYSMDVTYNKYRPAPGGYYKDSTMVSYGFSTLHSFELPITMRYTAARFSFFLGGNFLYTFAVNTGGAEQLVDPNTNPIVAANTANTAPSIKESDFGARFGVGYTCGIAYKVAPNVMLDFRNVQTVWDNAKASGSQAVSNQLYKSPSLQFSLFYRLGAGKSNKD